MDLLRDILLEHSQHPRNEGVLEAPCLHARQVNPGTGDAVEVYIRLVEGRVGAITWRAEGSAVLKASCSLMSEWARGREPESLLGGAAGFIQWLRGGEGVDTADFGDARALAGIRKYPARVACAGMPWRVLGIVLSDWQEKAASRGAS